MISTNACQHRRTEAAKTDPSDQASRQPATEGAVVIISAFGHGDHALKLYQASLGWLEAAAAIESGKARFEVHVKSMRAALASKFFCLAQEPGRNSLPPPIGLLACVRIDKAIEGQVSKIC